MNVRELILSKMNVGKKLTLAPEQRRGLVTVLTMKIEEAKPSQDSESTCTQNQ